LAALVASAPSTLNTLDELAAALGDDANFATTMANNLALKITAPTPTPGADRILFYDLSAGTWAFLSASGGIAISGTDMSLLAMSQADIENASHTTPMGMTGQRFQQGLRASGNAASETARGAVELATAAEALAGLSGSLAVTPAGLKPIVDAKAGAASAGASVWIGTLAAYNAIVTKSETTAYFIKG